MSIHRSLRGIDTLVGERSVLTRKERIAKLAKAGKFDREAGSVYGLPKVRTKFKILGTKRKKDDEEKPAAGAAPAAAAPPAKGKKA